MNLPIRKTNAAHYSKAKGRFFKIWAIYIWAIYHQQGYYRLFDLAVVKLDGPREVANSKSPRYGDLTLRLVRAMFLRSIAKGWGATIRSTEKSDDNVDILHLQISGLSREELEFLAKCDC